jgi:peptidoglycan/xylan/chitin deacetylase (PgdA/CDA1 family)
MEENAHAASPVVPENWLPAGKTAAVCFTIDDLHPQKSSDYYESGGDLERGVMRHVLRLLDRHRQLRVTLFTTADWREISSKPTRRLLAAIPWLRDRFFLAPRFPKGAMQLDRHPEFVRFLRDIPQAEIALHGLYHCHKGLRIPVEFQEQSVAEFREILRETIRIFDAAQLPFVRGICPPGWDAPANLLDALPEFGVRFVASARDVRTAPARDALTDMSGLRGVPLLFPAKIHGGDLLHFPTNFQATSDPRRAFEILDAGGLLAIKAHITPGMLDSVCDLYANFLDLLVAEIERRYGSQIFWTTMGEITARVFG